MEEVKIKRHNKIPNPYNKKHLYDHYLSIIDTTSMYYVDSETYYKIINQYYQAIMDQMINESKTIKLPFRLGHIYIEKKKPKFITHRNVGIDWVESKKLGRWVLFSNDHSRGFKFQFHWSKMFCRVVNREYYRFVASRNNKRTLAKVIKGGNVDYLER
jgi:hypothetical protein